MSNLATPDRILIIRPSALGDVCRTVPVLVSLKRAWPGADIDWVVRDSYLPAIEAHPDLTRAIPFPRARFARWWRSPSVAREMMNWFLDIRRQRYALVIDCQGLGRSGLISVCTGAPKRVGLRVAREFGWLAYNERVRCDPELHTVDQMMTLVKHLGIEPIYDMHLHIREESRSWWTQARREHGMEDGPYAVLAPTSRWSSKRWPETEFARLIGPLEERGYEGIVLIGAPDEQEQVSRLAQPKAGTHRKIINMVGLTTLDQTMAIVRDSALVIANDSAPLHMAVGFDRPCIALFGPTDPAKVGPYGRPEAVVQEYAPKPGESVHFKDSSLGDSLMRLITVERVLEHLDQHVRTPSPPGDPPRTSVKEASL